MRQRTDGLLGRIALKKGLLTPEQLREALGEQTALHKSGQKRPLGMILVARGLLREEDIIGLLGEQRRFLAEISNYPQVYREDFLFGQILIKHELATIEDINAALRLQAEAAERGESPVPRLGEILTQMGVSDEKTIQETLQIQRKTLFECRGCGLRYNLEKARSDRQYRCPKCAEVLTETAPGEGLRADESAYGFHLEIRENLPPEVAAAERDPSNQFGKYVFVKEIGRGGMGTVYKAYQKDLKRTVAIKVLKDEDGDTAGRFYHEARTAARLKHPNIVSIYEIGKYKDAPYLAMEYVEGTTLEHFKKLPIKKACALVRDVAMAVHYAHLKGIVHRDLKPQNILIDADGKPFVADFGLARDLSPSKSFTESGMIVGTPAYMSPEQARGARNVTGQSDVFGLGCVLFELLTGAQPFTGRTPMDVAIAVVNKDPAPPRRFNPAISAGLEAVILKAVEKDLERRYPTARALAEDLQRILEGETAVAKPLPVVTVAVRRFARNRLAAAVATGAAVLLIGAITLLFAAQRETERNRSRAQAQVAEKEGKLEEALALYEKNSEASAEVDRVRALLQRRQEMDELRRRAERVLARARQAAAPGDRLTLATQALALYPDLEEAYLLRAEGQEQLGNLQLAYAELADAARVSKNPLPHYVRRADLALKLKRRIDEIVDLTKAIEVSPNLSVDLYLRRAEARYQTGDFLGAADDWERVMERDHSLQTKLAPRIQEARQRTSN